MATKQRQNVADYKQKIGTTTSSSSTGGIEPHTTKSVHVAKGKPIPVE
jgi:hypothetical protein